MKTWSKILTDGARIPAFRTGMLANHLAMGLESSLGAGTKLLSHPTAHHCLCFSQRTCTNERTRVDQRSSFSHRTRTNERADVGQRTGIWLTSMGTTILYRRVSRIRFSSPSGWDAALPCRTCAHPGRTKT